MIEKFKRQAHKIEEMTPDERDRYADFLRAGSILVVVLGHWLVTYMTVEDGEIIADVLLQVVPETQWATWVVQVMPLFFFVGGMANAIGWESAQRKNESYINWLRKRARRLLWPVVPLILFWIPVVLLLDWLGSPADMLTLMNQAVLIPLWFLAAYMLVVMISPVAYWLHRKFGLAALGGFVVMALLCDIGHRSGVPVVGWLNYLWVWGAVHQAGFFWHDDRIPEAPWKGICIAAVGYAILVVLTQFFDYPLAMVGTGEAAPQPGDSNNTPPSIALLVLGAAQIGLISAFRRPVGRLLQKPLLWGAVVLVGSRIMTVYIWHMTAMVAVAAAAYPTGLWPDPEGVTAVWWLTRIPWVLLLTVALLILVFAFGRFERAREGRPTTLEGWPARLKAFGGVVLTVAGLGILITGGLYDAEGPMAVPVVPLVMLFVGLVGLGVVGTRLFGRWADTDPEPPPEDGNI